MKLIKNFLPGCLSPAAALLIALCLPASGHLKAAEGAANTRDTLFFDNFSGDNLDRSKWNVIVTGWTVNNEQQAYVDSASALYIAHGDKAEGSPDGALVIEANYRPGFTTKEGKKFSFTSGRIDTKRKFDFSYGTASARMKLPDGTGLWPAFWLLGSGRWPDTGEIDIMENVGEKDWTSVALHGPGYSGETPLVNKAYFSDSDVSKWHVYSVDWKPEGFVFYVDGVIVYRATRPMIENYGRWAYDNPKYIILNLALGGAYPVKTNGVKAPYPGIPEPTVNLIKSGNARVLVDWVLITQDK
ncbi:MAG: family 16 glycosylhydrolase [Bacteroidota bacterium]|jgi:beta-glucanase (GH16 family)|nr:glycoside hydrolase family 16 protein [Ignavibacteria bacterium]MCU7511591.1 glycoside hydrolase family 16 protein [Ignavibacteria bacterium]